MGFSTLYDSDAIQGHFRQYQAQIEFDPAKLSQSKVVISIDLASVNSGDAERDAMLKGGDFFDTAQFAKAVFRCDHFVKTAENHYIAKGKLTLHGITKAFDLPFTLKISDGKALMTASTSLNRTEFGVGAGEWAQTSAIPALVTLSFKIMARAKNS